MTFGYIYKFTNSINGKVYVGQTRAGLQVRYRLHKSNAAKGKKSRFYTAIRKYGFHAFTLESVDTAEDQQSLDNKERLWIAMLRSMDKTFGYNMTPGGDRVLYTPEVRAKISESSKRLRHTDSAKKLIGEKSKHM